MDREQLAWAAGFIDGEGSFFASKRRDRPNEKARIKLTVSQVNNFALLRLRHTLGMGIINGPYAPHPTSFSRQSQYRFAIEGFEKVQAALAMLWVWLGPVKREQARLALSGGQQNNGNVS